MSSPSRDPLPDPAALLQAPGVPAVAERLKSLRCLAAVARHGSAVRAAEAIHLSQPAVTRAVLELEKALQLPLFVRGARGMAPTVPGARVAQRAEALFAHLAQGATEALAAAPREARRSGGVLPERFAAAVAPPQLKAVAAVALHGSEARAAQALGVSQPAVHASLQGLEQLLGVRLFYKSAQGTRLTPSGHALLRRVKLALAEARAIEGDVAAWCGDIRGRLVIGALPLSVSIFLPRAVDTLLRRQPHIEVHIVDGTYESLLQQLLSADIDVIVGALRPGDALGEARQQVLFEDELVVVARAGHPCLAEPGLTLEALLRWDWVIPLQGTPAGAALAQLFASRGLPLPRGSLQANSPALTRALVLQTDRLALASRRQSLEDDSGGQLRIVPVPLGGTLRRIGTVVRAMSEPSPDLRLFLDECRAAVEGAPPVPGETPGKNPRE